MRFVAILLLSIAFVGCKDNSDESATTTRMAELRSEVGLPKVANFTEAKFANLTTELRDQEIRTWSYYLDIQGGRHLLCESIGYGLPYSVQVTNPMRTVNSYHDSSVIPQAEPNGLFMPESAEATWVLCSDGKGGVAPVYSEPALLVSPFPLGHVEAAENSGFADKVTIQGVPSESPKAERP